MMCTFDARDHLSR